MKSHKICLKPCKIELVSRKLRTMTIKFLQHHRYWIPDFIVNMKITYMKSILLHWIRLAGLEVCTLTYSKKSYTLLHTLARSNGPDMYIDTYKQISTHYSLTHAHYCSVLIGLRCNFVSIHALFYCKPSPTMFCAAPGHYALRRIPTYFHYSAVL